MSVWANFYLLVGPMAGTLIGLLFVVVTLVGGFPKVRIERVSKVYLTPIVFHLAIVVTTSALALVPALRPTTFGLAIAICAALGFGYSIVTTVRTFTEYGQEYEANFHDQLFFGFLPGFLYLSLAVSAAAFWLAPGYAPYAVSATILALLLLTIRNTWDAATYLIQPSKRNHGKP